MENSISESPSRYNKERFSSGHEGKGYSSFETQVTSTATSDNFHTGQSRNASLQISKIGKENIKLVPMKVKDLMELFQTHPQYTGKSPITMNMRESEIDNIIEKQHFYNSANTPIGSESLRQSIRFSPISMKHPIEQDYDLRHSFQQGFSSPYEQTSLSQPEDLQYDKKSKRPLGKYQPQVYAMTGIQAYPMVGGDRSAFKANKSRRKTQRKRSRQEIADEIKANRKKLRSRSRRPKSRSRSRGILPKSRSRRSRSRGILPKPRGRSKRRQSIPKKIIRVQSSRTPRETIMVRRKRRPMSPPPNRYCCTPYQLCDNDCSPITDPRRSSPATCNCTLCQKKLQFIQPGVCSQRKTTWTNEYAVIPKPQINLIDPCKELDPLIYPRADRPCIRDGQGNPLTDCIGRPLRDPTGKNFLKFSANGSVMDTNLRGNFFTGQPPLCVKCPLPGRSCGADATHNWWTSCGYPVKANMGPFYNSVLAAEHAQRRH